MRGSVDELPAKFQTKEFTVHSQQWGSMQLNYEVFRERLDMSELYRRMPSSRCPIPHWGYCIKGKIKVNYRDHEELIRAGDAYYLAPGHRLIVEAGTEFAEFSPRAGTKRIQKIFQENYSNSQEDSRTRDESLEALKMQV